MAKGKYFVKLELLISARGAIYEFVEEFREFAIRSNVVDLAVGVIIGATFGKIVSSLVADIIMPPLGLLIGGVDFKQFHLVLREAQGTVPAVVINHGSFIQTIFDFVIVAFAIFLAGRDADLVVRIDRQIPANELIMHFF